MRHQFSFREHHLFSILDLYEKQSYPLDLFLRNYFKSNKAVGSKDRKIVCDSLYMMIRWKELIDFLCEKPISWQNRYRFLQGFKPEEYFSNTEIPTHIRASFPKPFYDLLETSLGAEKAWEFCSNSNATAPVTIRVNPTKTTREHLLQHWKNQFGVTPCIYSSLGITFNKKENFFSLPEFKQGLFEVQDEASQLIADLMAPQSTDHVLDYCAGSGGKTLAFAHKMQGRGQIFLHDVRSLALQEAKKRLKRAGIQNAQLLLPDSPHKKRLFKTMDWVLVDAPCSGTGTIRRNPDMKWKFDPDMISRLTALQREIVQEAFSFLKPGGHLIYATCSVLPQENEEQLKFFTEQLPLQLMKPPLHTFPTPNGMDGFYGVVLKNCPM